MRFLIEAFNAESFDDVVASEARWGLNLGHMMACNGHEVSFINSGNGRLVNWDRNPAVPYDVCFQATYGSDDRGARVVVHGQTGWTQLGRETQQQYGSHHFVAMAWATDIPAECQSFARTLPWPCIERIDWEKSNENAPLLALCPRRVFEEHCRDTAEIRIGEEMIHCAIDLAEELGLALHLLQAESRLDRPLLPEGLRRRIFGEHRSPVVVTYGRLPRPKVLDILRQTRLLLDVTPANSMIPVEAIALGAAVPVWKSGYLEYDGDLHFDYLPDRDYIRGHVKDSLRRLCTDQDLYCGYLADLRSDARKYTYEETYPLHLLAFQEMLDRVRK